MNDTERELLAETMVPVALELVSAVRTSAADVAATLDGRSEQELLALSVVLAAMVDPDRSTSQLLSWIDPLAAARTRVEHMSDAELRPLHARYIAHRTAMQRGQLLPELPQQVIDAEREYHRRRYVLRRRAAARQQHA